MQRKVTEIITHMAKSHLEMARILEANRHIAVRMSNIIHALPDSKLGFDGIEGVIEKSGNITKSLVAYLNCIAELEEAMADTVGHVMKEMGEVEEE